MIFNLSDQLVRTSVNRFCCHRPLKLLIDSAASMLVILMGLKSFYCWLKIQFSNIVFTASSRPLILNDGGFNFRVQVT